VLAFSLSGKKTLGKGESRRHGVFTAFLIRTPRRNVYIDEPPGAVFPPIANVVCRCRCGWWTIDCFRTTEPLPGGGVPSFLSILSTTSAVAFVVPRIDCVLLLVYVFSPRSTEEPWDRCWCDVWYRDDRHCCYGRCCLRPPRCH
jgi:hypothetical protein